MDGVSYFYKISFPKDYADNFQMLVINFSPGGNNVGEKNLVEYFHS